MDIIPVRDFTFLENAKKIRNRGNDYGLIQLAPYVHEAVNDFGQEDGKGSTPQHVISEVTLAIKTIWRPIAGDKPSSPASKDDEAS